MNFKLFFTIIVTILSLNLLASEVINQDFGNARFIKKTIKFSLQECLPTLQPLNNGTKWGCQFQLQNDIPFNFVLQSNDAYKNNVVVNTSHFATPTRSPIKVQTECKVLFHAGTNIVQASVDKKYSSSPNHTKLEAQYCLSVAYKELDLENRPLSLFIITN